MTREEAIKVLENGSWWDSLDDDISDADMNPLQDALDLALAALRGPTREMVERMFPGCEMCEGWNTIKLKPCANGDLGVQADIGSAGKDDTFGLVVYNHLLASGYVDFSFCPFCGKPKTDEAVDIVLERWKELYETTE